MALGSGCSYKIYVRGVHDRMPVLLRSDDYDRWLDPDERDTDKLERLLVPCPDDWLVSQLVGPRVNSPRHDDEDCLLPPTEHQPSLF